MFRKHMEKQARKREVEELEKASAPDHHELKDDLEDILNELDALIESNTLEIDALAYRQVGGE